MSLTPLNSISFSEIRFNQAKGMSLASHALMKSDYKIFEQCDDTIRVACSTSRR